MASWPSPGGGGGHNRGTTGEGCGGGQIVFEAMEGPVGFEPTALGLKVPRSTAELRAQSLSMGGSCRPVKASWAWLADQGLQGQAIGPRNKRWPPGRGSRRLLTQVGLLQDKPLPPLTRASAPVILRRLERPTQGAYLNS